MKIGIIGVGAYSVALAKMLSKKCENIWMWTESQARYDKYLEDGCIKDVIPRVSLPSFIKMSLNKKEVVMDANIVIIASAAAFVGEICRDIKYAIKNDTVVCIASKGIENRSCRFLSDLATDILNIKNIHIIKIWYIFLLSYFIIVWKCISSFIKDI